MIAFRPVLFVVGILLVTLAAGMILPAAVDAGYGNPDWQVFATASAITMFVGLALVLSCRSGRFRINLRQAFVLTALSWLMITLFAPLPFRFSNLDLSVTDAVFEAMSGITTTGSTVIIGLDTAPPGILVWRPAPVAGWAWHHRHGDLGHADAGRGRHANVPRRGVRDRGKDAATGGADLHCGSASSMSA